MRIRGRGWSILLAGLAFAVVGVVAFLARHWFVEQWYATRLDSPWTEERWAAAETLERMGSSAAEDWYLERLSSEESDERSLAAERLGRMGSPRAVSPLLEILRNDAAIRELKPRLVRRSPNWPFGGPTLRLPGSPGWVRRLDEAFWEEFWPGRALAAIGEPAIPALVGALGDGDEFVRVAASDALARLGIAVVPAVVRVVESATATNEAQRRAFYVLWYLGPEAAEAVPALCRLLADEQWKQENAAWVLGKIGAGAKEAVPALEGILRSVSNPDVRFVVESALHRISKALEAEGEAPGR